MGQVMNTAAAREIQCQRVEPTRAIATLTEDVSNGLFSEPRTLPPKYFYDERGSVLFDRICGAPEYYPTRTESELLESVAGEIIDDVRPRQILEFGSGMSRKTRHLLDACGDLSWHPVYAPFDVCDDVLMASGISLNEHYEWLSVEPLVGDYTAGLGNLPMPKGGNLVVFLGGTIGNFIPVEAMDFLRELRSVMSPGDGLLMGADRVKEPDILHSAYNDSAGLTAQFNLNLLRVLNRELGANFDIKGFAHYAHFNPVESRIEMHLISMRAQIVEFEDIQQSVDFGEGDAILTEISRKFTRGDLEAMLIEAGFTIAAHHESGSLKFSLILAHPA